MGIGVLLRGLGAGRRLPSAQSHAPGEVVARATRYALAARDGRGDYAFADLSRRARVGYDQRDRLSATLERFREASQAMPDGVLYLSESNAINWINRRAEEHFGLDHGRDLGAPVTNLVRQPDFVHYLEAGDYAEPLLMRRRAMPDIRWWSRSFPTPKTRRWCCRGT